MFELLKTGWVIRYSKRASSLFYLEGREIGRDCHLETEMNTTLKTKKDTFDGKQTNLTNVRINGINRKYVKSDN